MRQFALLAAVSMTVVGGSGSLGHAAAFYQYAKISLADTATVGGASAIGSNPVAVSWNGTDAIIAGYNGGATARDVALVKVSSVLTSPTLGSSFGIKAATPSNRGYLSVDVKGTTDIATTYDSGSLAVVGSTPAASYTMFNYDGTQRWNVVPAARPPVGAAFDTMSSRVSFMYQGTNAIQNYDVTAGTSTGTPASQVNTITPSLGTAFRDLDYAPNGDAWIRVNNNVVRANRSSASAYSSATLVVDTAADGNQVGQNIAYLGGLATEFAIYNSRASAGSGTTPFASVVAGVRGDGTPEPLSFLSGDGLSSLTFADGVGIYDFSWDAASQTLALLDYSSRDLYIFGTTAVVPEPTALTLLSLPILAILRRNRR